ncbi:hypothetical protein Hanom_Chr01g00050971 [Helianthus anomalus]
MVSLTFKHSRPYIILCKPFAHLHSLFQNAKSIFLASDYVCLGNKKTNVMLHCVAIESRIILKPIADTRCVA